MLISPAIALAGHLALSNLVLLYDNNQVTCDGPLDWINTEDVNAKMIASGWEVINVFDGRYDVRAIVSALDLSKNTSKPVFINIRTVIGIDMASAGTAKAHHGAFDEKSIAASKELAGLKADSRYEIPEESLQYLRTSREKGAAAQEKWNKAVEAYSREYPEESKKFEARRNGSQGEFQTLLDG